MEEFWLVPAAIALGAVSVATYTDLKKRIIPNRLTIPLIVLGVCLNLGAGIYLNDPWVAASGILGATIAFAIGYGLWLAGGWAGGDVKLFTALGALLPSFSIALSWYQAAPYASQYPLFPLTILFNSVLILLPVLLVYAVMCKLRGHGILYERVKITELREGVIPAEAIYIEDGKVKRQRWVGSLKGKKLLANPRMAAGLTRYQVGTLKRLVKERKLQNQILTKKGMPFGPALAAGTWVGIFFGDIYWSLSSYLL